MCIHGTGYSPVDMSVGDDRTKQSFKDECDVNLIMKRFEVTGLIDHLADGVPVYADVSSVGDYRTAIENVRAVEKYFSGLPVAVRTEFGNDALRFMEYLDGGASAEDLERLGLEVLGERRARTPDTRSGDVPPVVETAPPESEEPSGTVST